MSREWFGAECAEIAIAVTHCAISASATAAVKLDEIF